MPNIKSAAKRMRTSEKARQKNFSEKSLIKTVRATVRAAATSRDGTALSEAFRRYCSVLDKAVKHGVIKKNTAVRRKGRAAAMLQAVPK